MGFVRQHWFGFIVTLVLLLSAGAQYESGATPPAVGPLFAIAGCICLGKESFGCSVTLPRR